MRQKLILTKAPFTLLKHIIRILGKVVGREAYFKGQPYDVGYLTGSGVTRKRLEAANDGAYGGRDGWCA